VDEKDLQIQRLKQELAKWHGRAIEAAQEACAICKAHVRPDGEDCRVCRMQEMQKGGK